MADDSTETTEITAPAPVSDTVRALLVERAGYLRQGKTERAALVDEQLRLRGYTETTASTADAPPTSRGRRTTKG